MQRPIATASILAAIFVTAVAPAGAARAQVGRPCERSANSCISLEVVKPGFHDDDFDYTFMSSTLRLNGRIRATERLFFEGELPFVSAAEGVGDWSASAIGNPYLGLAAVLPNSSATLSLGFRLPLTRDDEEDANILGIYSDVSSYEAFLPDVAAASLAANFSRYLGSHARIEPHLGGSLLLDTSGNSQIDPEFLIDYGIDLSYDRRAISLGAGFIGRSILTEEGDFGERSFAELELSAGYRLGALTPRLRFRLPLDDDLNDALAYVASFSISIGIPGRRGS
ncbi:MAG: hypothetical protein ACREMQ_13855 [Longimicrobiales bacterium]